MSNGLTSRLEDIPGVASVAVDISDSGGGINVRLESDADESSVIERLHSVLVAYGVRSPGPPKLRPTPSIPPATEDPGVSVSITPIKAGARIEVATLNVKSFRIVAATPEAIVQGLADAWCQVIGQVPVEITEVDLASDGTISVTASNGDREITATSNVTIGWEAALADAVNGVLEPFRLVIQPRPMAVNS